MKRTRQSLKYKIFHFFHTLTIKDFIYLKNFTIEFINDIAMILVFFIVIFILPAMFH